MLTVWEILVESFEGFGRIGEKSLESVSIVKTNVVVGCRIKV
jgi:hypothetical protein